MHPAPVEGVRAGRKLHLNGMAEDAFRARYTALSNTLIGLALLASPQSRNPRRAAPRRRIAYPVHAQPTQYGE